VEKTDTEKNKMQQRKNDANGLCVNRCIWPKQRFFLHEKLRKN